MQRKRHALTLVEGLLVVALGGLALLTLRPERPVLGPVTTPQHAQAQDEMAQVGAAMVAWLTDQVGRGSISPAQTSCLVVGDLDFTAVPAISHADLEALLVPDYLAVLHQIDPWGNAYELGLDTDPFAPTFGFIRSAAGDGVFAGDLYSSGFTSGPDDDLVWARGGFLRQMPPPGEIGRQQQSVQEIVHVGTAMLGWLTDQVARRDPAAPLPYDRGAGALEMASYDPVDYATVLARLVPLYASCLPEHDPWGHPYDYRMNDDLLGAQVLAIRSAGRNGSFETDSYPLIGFPADQFDEDLVWADGVFVRVPIGEHDTLFADGFERGIWGSWVAAP